MRIAVKVKFTDGTVRTNLSLLVPKDVTTIPAYLAMYPNFGTLDVDGETILYPHSYSEFLETPQMRLCFLPPDSQGI